MKLLKKLAPYRKSITAAAVGAVGWASVVVASTPAHITSSEWLGLAVAAATVAGVYTVPNAKA